MGLFLGFFCLVPLIYISVFVPVPYCLDECGFVVEPEVRQVEWEKMGANKATDKQLISM